ncbi:glycosyltransferase [uncultured Roseivirga sp.]|uniref:glycosyltransferase n=1 Tax=uncultured Roseivirga sp. TaxID=543088 RepID=UPI00258D7BD6|nr:glycosyltransferase [uncultured Roseivirga sp.]MEC7754771.1 glycosyltransferase [Bacteroidota bacterium]
MSQLKVYLYPSLGGSFSMNRYLNGVVQGLKSNGLDYEIVRPKGSGLIAKYLHYILLVWRRKREKGKHLIISERYAYLLPFMGKERIVVCHDLHTLYPESNTAWIHRRIYRLFLKLMSRAERVVCVSNHTKGDLLEFMPSFKSHEGIRVVHNGIEPFWEESGEVKTNHEVLKTLFKSKRVVLSVGTDAWYKNNSWSLKLMYELPEDFHLLRIGSFNSSNEELIKALDIKNRVTRLQNLSDSDLKHCYQNAEALLFPSLTEGFGWPALEAALCGCHVISNGTGALKEIFENTQGLVKLDEAKRFLTNNDKESASLNYKFWNAQVIELIA